MSFTLSSILSSQNSLLQEASEALPHQFSQCTYSLGPIRQAVYLCITCGEYRGICSSCSIACHTDHEQLELFPKRAFRCDCPTRAMHHPCALHKAPEDANATNTYGPNFAGTFCRCGRPYDAQQERETMIQCLACEDWFHESCLDLRARPTSRPPSPEPAEADDDAASEASSSGLPPPRIRAEDYDCLICSACVRAIPTLRRYAGTSGVLVVVRDGTEQDSWSVIGRDDVTETSAVEVQSSAEAEPGTTPDTGEKRTRSPTAEDAPHAKRARVSLEPPVFAPCLAPTPNAIAQKIYARSELSISDPNAGACEPVSLGKGDVFLTEGWRERWCRCDNCLPSLNAHPYLLEEEETYEPPEDPDSGLSLEELGLRALQHLPRDRAIDGIRAFNEMRDDLMNHLRPFAQEGREVTEADIREFFDARTQAAAP
ncbi:hypothetical protein B0H21DRAFT_721604 [Amylocystis lapponica]|nr:hypothetical protein B0H21DRAFT_721604 [Amylocystis lapponica]